MPAQTSLGRALFQAREQTDDLFGLVRPDSLYERPIPERHRIIFYMGHLEAFDWNLIARYALDKPAFHAAFDKLFAFGIDPPPGKLPADQPSDWPSLAEVELYNRRTRDEIDELLDEVPRGVISTMTPPAPLCAIVLAISESVGPEVDCCSSRPFCCTSAISCDCALVATRLSSASRIRK